jgi:hypothetical protein
MAVATITATINSFPNGIDNTMRRIHAYGNCSIVGASPSYVQGGIRINYSPLEKLHAVTMVPQWSEFYSGQNTGFIYLSNPLGFQITNVALTTNVVTITAKNSLAAGDVVTLSGITTATFLNGQTLTVLAGGLSATAFTANFTHANYGTAGDTGFVLPVTYASGQPFQGLLQIFTGAAAQAALTELATGALPAGVVGSATVNADIIQFQAEFIRAL